MYLPRRGEALRPLATKQPEYRVGPGPDSRWRARAVATLVYLLLIPAGAWAQAAGPDPSIEQQPSVADSVEDADRSGLPAMPVQVVVGEATADSIDHAAATASASSLSSPTVPRIEAVRIGFQGSYRVGHWTPLWVSLGGVPHEAEVRLKVTVPDGDDVASQIISEPIRLLPAASQTVLTLARFGRVDSGSIGVDLLAADDTVLASRRVSGDELPEALAAGRQLVLTLGSNIGLGEVASQRHVRAEERVVHVQIDSASELPQDWLGYAGVNVVFLPTGDRSFVDRLTPLQLQALRQWVQLGGRLVISAAANAEQLLGDGGPLYFFAPGKFDRVTAQRQTSGIEAFAGTSDRLDTIVRKGELSFSFPVALFETLSGRVQAYERANREQPATIVRSPYGLGQVTFVAFDLDRSPVTEWTNGRPKLVAALLDLSLGITRSTGEKFGHQDVAHLGFNDILGQLRSALDQFSGVRLVPFSLIAALIVVYIALIGPGDFLLLKKVFRGRFATTWITFPLLVAAACLLAIWLALQLKGNVLLLNRVEVVDVDVESGVVRGLSWGHLFSPRNATYDLQLQVSSAFSATRPLPAATPSGTADGGPKGSFAGRWIGWQGLPGDSFGGMHTSSRLSEAQAYQFEFRRSAEGNVAGEVHGLPIDVWASRSLHGEWWQEIALAKAAELAADGNHQLQGVITNPLPFDLADCVLCYDRWAYELHTPLKAGQRRSLADVSRPVTMARWLTKKTVIDGKDRNTPWDRYALNVPRILEMMMFHEAAGGRQYTKLLHHFQSRVDLSEHLQIGRAILLGKSSVAASELRVGKSDLPISGERWNYYRVILPVVPTAGYEAGR